MSKHWLFKTEPGTYSFAQLLRDRKTNWDHVRNFQARNFLREAKKGDLAFIYHSGDEKSVVGIAEITREAYADPDPEKPGEWVQVDVRAVEALERAVSLKEIKAAPELAGLPLIKHTRLSCMPISAAQFQAIRKMGRRA